MLVPSPLARGPSGSTISGTYVGGLLGRAVERAGGHPELQPARLTVDLLRPVALAEPVRVELRDGADRFEVMVSDRVPNDDPAGEGATQVSSDLAELNGDLNLGFAVIAGLADDVDIASTPSGVEITMSWPAKKD